MSASAGQFDLRGRVAVVTGGNRGLGRAIALALAEAGAAVAIIARDEQKSRETLDMLAERGGHRAQGGFYPAARLSGVVDRSGTATRPGEYPVVNNAAFANLKGVLEKALRNGTR